MTGHKNVTENQITSKNYSGLGLKIKSPIRAEALNASPQAPASIPALAFYQAIRLCGSNDRVLDTGAIELPHSKYR